MSGAIGSPLREKQSTPRAGEVGSFLRDVLLDRHTVLELDGFQGADDVELWLA